MNIRPYHPENDREAGHRIWKEIHWLKKDQEKFMDYFLSACRVLVVDINETPECLVTSAPGDFQYQQEHLRLSAITGVTTSLIARKQGLASHATAELIAADAQEGAQIAALGMFEQGFYNQLGFGTGPYEHEIRFDPADLTINTSFRVPQRLSDKDWEAMHQAALNRRRGHGSCNLFDANLTRAELAWTDDSFGLGYSDGPDHALTHFFWATQEAEFGPCTIKILVYQTHAQFIELMALIKSMGDQVRLVILHEPPEIQIQDLIRQPFRGMTISKRSSFEQHHRADAYWQVRICDLSGCIEKTHLMGNPVRFNLVLHDPIEQHLDAATAWRGVSGEYVVTLGPESSLESGTSALLPTLTASVGAFTRLWLGVRPATGLAVTDMLRGPAELLQALDRLLILPRAYLGWEF